MQQWALTSGLVGGSEASVSVSLAHKHFLEWYGRRYLGRPVPLYRFGPLVRRLLPVDEGGLLRLEVNPACGLKAWGERLSDQRERRGAKRV